MIEKIAFVNKYNEEMRKSMMDKLFFIDKIDAEVIVDYGCADGTMIEFLINMFPEKRYVGFDNDPKMIEIAQERLKEYNNAVFPYDWNDDIIKNRKSAVICSSLIHEIYSYSNVYEIAEFWERVSQFDYIAIRDMSVSKTAIRPSNPLDVVKIPHDERLEEFILECGSICDNYHLIHYLLKYRYVENWKREVRENYLGITTEQLIEALPKTHKIIHYEHYVLPFLAAQVKKDFDIELKDNTHVKIILERK